MFAAHCPPPWPTACLCLTLLAVSLVLAAKSIDNGLNMDLAEFQENTGGPQLLAQTAARLPCAAATALPLQGNLRPEALLPVIVQPQLIPGAAYTPPNTGAARGRCNPLSGRLLRGRSGL